MKFECPHCGRSLKAPESASGKRTTCPGCNGLFVVPEPVFDAEEVEAVGDELRLEPFAERSSPRHDDGSRRPCPACGEMIVSFAVKCRFCGEIFDPKLKKAARRQADSDDAMTAVDWILAVLCSFVGCIVGIVYMTQGKSKGPRMFGISLLMTVLGGIVQVLIMSQMELDEP